MDNLDYIVISIAFLCISIIFLCTMFGIFFFRDQVINNYYKIINNILVGISIIAFIISIGLLFYSKKCYSFKQIDKKMEILLED